MNSRSLTLPSCQQLSLPRIQLNCSDTCHTRSATHLLCHDQRSHDRCQFRGNSPSSREECACARPFDATQWPHQLLYTACPVNSCSAICLALGSGGRFGTLGTSASSPSTSSRIRSCAPPRTSGSCAPRAPPGTSGFSGLTGSDPAGNPPRTRTVASHPLGFM